jgi:dTDP-4-dehydrorhamnose reductase
VKLLLTGAAGRLGQALRQQAPAGVELIATSRNGGAGLLPLDLADAAACRAAVLEHRPDWVLNGGGAPRAFAEALVETGGRLLQVSTDFVFNGQQRSPYRPEQARDPRGVHGATKAAREEAVEEALGSSGQGVILRTSWVMGLVGKNFALTMLRLHRERGASGQALGVVADQVGCPTSTATLAAACWRVIAAMDTPAGLPAVMHWSDAGAASWYDVAVAVGELGLELGLLERAAVVNPITTADYPNPAQRPSYSLLACSSTRQALDLPPTHWQQALRRLLEAVR